MEAVHDEEDGLAERTTLVFDSITDQKLFRLAKAKPLGSENEEVAFPSCTSPSTNALDGRVWTHLPEELIDGVLARLPPVCFFRLRRVCRRWNSVLNESWFLKVISELPTHGPCFLMSEKSDETWRSAVYSYAMDAWHSLPFTFIPSKTHSLIASAGGLLCFSSLQGRHDEFLVCNPFSKECKFLPGMHYSRQLGFANMFVDKKARRYRIITAGDRNHATSDRVIPTEVYDSKANSWAVYESMPVGNIHSWKSAFCNGRLYCLTLSPCGLVTFDNDSGMWESVCVRMPDSLFDAFLVAGDSGYLLLVGRLGLYSVHQSIRI